MMAADVCECEAIILCVPIGEDPPMRQLPSLQRTLRQFQFERVSSQIFEIDSHLLYGIEC
jgi:hypothetical protein